MVVVCFFKGFARRESKMGRPKKIDNGVVMGEGPSGRYNDITWMNPLSRVEGCEPYIRCISLLNYPRVEGLPCMIKVIVKPESHL